MFHISPLLGILWGCQRNFHLILIDYTPNKNQQILRSINNGMFNKILQITIHGDILDVMEHNEKYWNIMGDICVYIYIYVT